MEIPKLLSFEEFFEGKWAYQYHCYSMSRKNYLGTCMGICDHEPITDEDTIFNCKVSELTPEQREEFKYKLDDYYKLYLYYNEPTEENKFFWENEHKLIAMIPFTWDYEYEVYYLNEPNGKLNRFVNNIDHYNELDEYHKRNLVYMAANGLAAMNDWEP